ncbi:MAG: hypothetical protein Q8K32_31280 [Archangium sp.]|nr:hypothetical protein [Archangium sp.]
MTEVTTSNQAEWDHVLPALGTRYVTCPDCGGLCRETSTGYPHGVRWVLLKGRMVKQDCVGREVR